MHSLFPVMIGGAIGAGARHLVGQAMLARLGPGFPWETLTINIAGSLLMGLLVGALARGRDGGETARLLIGVGILGGFTNFSSFSMRSEARRVGKECVRKCSSRWPPDHEKKKTS